MDIDGGGGGGGLLKTKLTENEWTRVWGRLKAFNNRRHVGAYVMRPITDKMEITYHLLEATYVHLYFTRGPLDQIKQEDGTGASHGNVYYGAQDDGGAAAAAGAGAGAGGGNFSMNGRSMVPNVTQWARKVYDTIRDSPQNNEGLHLQNIAARCGMNVADVVKAGQELMDKGMIYTTVDDNTWALLEL